MGGKTSDVLISDASAGGMGVLTWDELQTGDVVEIEIENIGVLRNPVVAEGRAP